MRHILIITCGALLAATPHSGEAQAFANDMEPNNTIATALPLALGSAAEGHLHGDGGDEFDLYTINVPDGGDLLLAIECEQASTGGLPLAVHSVEMDSAVGMTVALGTMGNGGTVQVTSATLFCLDAGTQMIQVSRTGDACSYRITAQFVPLAFPGDPEPNDDPASATPLAEGVQATGHLSVGQPYPVPAYDIWRIDKPTAGPITFSTAFTSNGNTADPWMTLDITDQNGTSLPGWETFVVDVGLNGTTALDTLTITSAMDAPGTYYLRFNYLYTSCMAYRIEWNSTAVGVAESVSEPDLRYALDHGWLTLSSAIGGPCQVVLLDGIGRRVVGPVAQPSFPCRINIGQLANGTYTAVVQRSNGQHMALRVPIQR